MKRASVCAIGSAAVAALLACVVAAQAADTEWVAGEAHWFQDINWTSGSPTSEDYAYIGNGGTALIITADAFAEELEVGSGADPWNWAGEGYVRQTGSEADFDRLYVGHLEGSRGTYVLDGGVLDTNGTDIGTWGNGLFRQNGGSHYSMGTLHLGHAYPVLRSSNQGVYVLVDGYLNALGLTCGGNGTAIFRQYGGICRIDGHAGVGGRDSSASLELLGGDFFAHGVSVESDGQFVQTAATARIGDLTVSSTGFADMLDGLLECREVGVGGDGGGAFNQFGGLHTISDSLHIGADVGDTGAYMIHGGILDVGEGTIDVGLAGTGVLHMEGGTAIAASITRGTGGSITASTPAATLRVNGLHGLCRTCSRSAERCNSATQAESALA